MANKEPEGRAATPERKRAVIERLYAAWVIRSDERLGQLIENATHDCTTTNAYYVEDERLAVAVESYVRR